jgi:hypothetical protein
MSETTTKSNLIAEQKIVLVDFLEKHPKSKTAEFRVAFTEKKLLKNNWKNWLQF